jgi:hypothetical protein
MMAILDAGFDMTDEQRAHQREIQDWLDNTYMSEVARLNEEIVEGKLELRRLTRIQVDLEKRARRREY